MNLLITGSTGFLGRRVTLHFESLGARVLAPVRSSLDITDRTAVMNWFLENRPEAVIHTAAISDTGLCQRKPQWSETVNVTSCLHLAEACGEVGAKLVICSSDQVYSGSSLPGPHRETESLFPGNIYGCQKLRAEEECLKLLPETVCLRLSWMYATDFLPRDRDHFLSRLKRALGDSREPLTWPVYDVRGITDAADVVMNLPAALQLPGGVWNFGSENDRSTYDTVRTLLEEGKLEEPLCRLSPNEEAFRDNPRDLSMDPAKLNEAGIRFPSTLAGLKAALGIH